MNKKVAPAMKLKKVKPVYRTLTLHTYRVGGKKFITRKVLSR